MAFNLEWYEIEEGIKRAEIRIPFYIQQRPVCIYYLVVHCDARVSCLSYAQIII